MQKFNSYKELIEFAKSQTRTKNSYVYYEKHHIVPRSEGGTDDKENIVLLTLYEHLLAHYLRACEYASIGDKQKEANNIFACEYILSGCKKHFQVAEAKAYLETIMNTDEMTELLRKLEWKRQGQQSPIKGKSFVMKNNTRKMIDQSEVSQYVNRGWVKQTVKFFWFQLNNQKPCRFSERKLEKRLQEGFVKIECCPICGNKNSDEDWCCCAEHHEQFEKERKELQSKVNSEKAKNTWEGDNTERLRKIGEANKIALKGKHWMNKDGVSKQFAPEDIEKAILDGWKKGRIMPNNPVLSRWNKG